jgi:hypothetical protein
LEGTSAPDFSDLEPELGADVFEQPFLVAAQLAGKMAVVVQHGLERASDLANPLAASMRVGK